MTWRCDRTVQYLQHIMRLLNKNFVCLFKYYLIYNTLKLQSIFTMANRNSKQEFPKTLIEFGYEFDGKY